MTDVGRTGVRSDQKVLARAPDPRAARYRRASILGIAAIAGLLLAFAFLTGTFSNKRRPADAPSAERTPHSTGETIEDLGRLPKTYSAAFSAQQAFEERERPLTATAPDPIPAQPPLSTDPPGRAVAEAAGSAMFLNASGTIQGGRAMNVDAALRASADTAQQEAGTSPMGAAPPAPKLEAATYHNAPAAFAIQAGDLIEGALLTALNSDLPGVALAQVTRDVFDHASGQTLLIPHGSRLFGHYDSRIGYGQNRASVVWERIVMPDGSSVDLRNMVGADAEGQSGLGGAVDDHIGAIARAIGLSTALITGSALAQNAGSRSTPNLVLNDAQGGVAAAASQVGDRFVERDLARKPTIKVASGWPVLIVVDKDLALPPYREGRAQRGRD